MVPIHRSQFCRHVLYAVTVDKMLGEKCVVFEAVEPRPLPRTSGRNRQDGAHVTECVCAADQQINRFGHETVLLEVISHF